MQGESTGGVCETAGDGQVAASQGVGSEVVFAFPGAPTLSRLSWPDCGVVTGGGYCWALDDVYAADAGGLAGQVVGDHVQCEPRGVRSEVPGG